MSLSTAQRPFTTTPPTSTPNLTPNLTPHRRLSRKRIPSPPRLIDFSAFESSRVPQVSLHTYPSTSSLADLYASHGRITPLRRSPPGSRCSSRGGAKLGFDSGDELQMFTAVIPGSHGGIQLPPTPPSGSGGEGDDDDGGVPLGMELEGPYPVMPRNRRVLRRVKANIQDVSPPPASTVASDSTTTLGSPPTPPKEQAAMVLHHPRPLNKSPKSAYFQESHLTGRHGEEEEGSRDEREMNGYYFRHDRREDIPIAYEGDLIFFNDERDEEQFEEEEQFEVKRAESIKLTKAEKAESIKLRKAEELEIKKIEEQIGTRRGEEQHPTTRERVAVQIHQDFVPIKLNTEQELVQFHQETPPPLAEAMEMLHIEEISLTPEPQFELGSQTSLILPSTAYEPSEVDEILHPVAYAPSEADEILPSTTYAPSVAETETEVEDEAGVELSVPFMSPNIEPTIFSDESDFETAAEGTDASDVESEPETILPSTTYMPEETLPATTYVPSEADDSEHPRRLSIVISPATLTALSPSPTPLLEDNSDLDSNSDLGVHLTTGQTRGRKPTPWPTPRVNSFASSANSRVDSTSPVLSEDGDLVFHDAPSSPLTSPVITTRDDNNTLGILYSASNPPKKPEFTITFGPAPSRNGLLVTEPETPTKSSQVTGPPTLNIIPATPAPLMSPTAVLEKQLGDHSLLQRRPTGDIPLLTTTSPTMPTEPGTPPEKPKKSARPSLLVHSKRVRESKLHPWWRPRPEYGAEDEGLSRTLSAGSELSVACAGTGSVIGRKDGGKRRVTRKIKGTRFQIEFIGLGTLRDKVRVAGEKTSGLGRKMSLRGRKEGCMTSEK